MYVCVRCAAYVAATVGDSCPAGTATITSKAECEWAAEALRGQTHETDMSADYSPMLTKRISEGCGYTNGFLYFYPNANGDCRKGSGHTCLCKVTEVAENDSCNARCTFASLIPVVAPIVSLIGIVVSSLAGIYCCHKAGVCCFRKQQARAGE